MKLSKRFTKNTTQNLCPCQSGNPYSTCCGAYHLGLAAPTAEALMRSRYAAFVLGLEQYLLQTWHPDTRPATLNLNEDPPTKWLGLQVKRSTNTNETSAMVEFVAHFKINGKAEKIHEISQFVRIDGYWYYLAGDNLA